MTVEMYGIPNCDTIRKARKWLDRHQIAYVFHDYKKEGVTAEQLQRWCDQVGWEVLLNKRGTSWRQLPEADKLDPDRDKAIRLMLEHTSMIKRPVLDVDGHIEVGFSEARYESLLK